MSPRKIYISMIMWAAFGLMAMATAWLIAAQAYPEWHPAAYMAVAILAFNAVYWLRAYARKRGWAVASYAPR
jgi:hypothetical protein